MSMKQPRSTMTRCGNARRYKALNPPTCGCDMCAIKYRMEQIRREIRSSIDRVDNDRFYL
jgi:hypothetical protein